MKKREKLVWVCLLSLIGVIYAGDAAATKPSLIFAAGDVKLSADGVSWQKGAKGAQLDRGWLVAVGKGGGAVISFPDGSEVKVDADSRMRITDLRFRGKSKVIKLKLAYGRLLARVKKLLTKDSRFNVSAGSAVCGVRGTEFMVGFRDNKFEVRNVEGEVFVRLQDEIRYLSGGRKIGGDMKSLGKVLRLDKADRKEVGEMQRGLRGAVAPGVGAALRPRGQRNVDAPRLGLRRGERGDLGMRSGRVGAHLRNTIRHLIVDGGNTLDEGSSNATGDVILPNVNVVIIYQ